MNLKLFNLLENFDYLTLVGITLIFYVTHYYIKYFNRINPLPGPFPFPFFGNLPQLYIGHGGDFKKFFNYNQKKYGDIFEVTLSARIIVLNRSEHIEKLLSAATKNPHLAKTSEESGKGFRELGVAGKGLIFNQDFKSWRYNRQFFTRAILSPKFSHEATHWINNFFEDFESYMDKLYIYGDNKKAVDFSTWTNQFTNDTVISLLTGESSYTMAGYFNELSNNEKAEHSSALIDETVNFVHAIRKFIMGFLMFQIVPSFLRHYFPYFKNKSDDMMQNMEYLNQRFDSIIKKRRKIIENTPLDKPLSNDMLTSIIVANTPRDFNYKNANREAIRPMTDPEIRGIIFDGIVAGTDTTANTILYIIYSLAHNQDVKKKMLEEIDSVFQDNNTRPITEEDYHKLRYCEAIVKEVSRMHTIVNTIQRCLARPEEIAGYQWPANTCMRINIDAIHHNSDCWEDPDKFNPDRWLVEGFEPKKNSFVAFGGGLRFCPGRKLAMIELVCFMALLFRKYDVDLADMEAPLKTASASLTVCTELLVKIKLRN